MGDKVSIIQNGNFKIKQTQFFMKIIEDNLNFFKELIFFKKCEIFYLKDLL